ncbi:unnamed protein product, partial [Closterium sp. NIES-64]
FTPLFLLISPSSSPRFIFLSPTFPLPLFLSTLFPLLPVPTVLIYFPLTLFLSPPFPHPPSSYPLSLSHRHISPCPFPLLPSSPSFPAFPSPTLVFSPSPWLLQ